MEKIERMGTSFAEPPPAADDPSPAQKRVEDAAQELEDSLQDLGKEKLTENARYLIETCGTMVEERDEE